MESLPVVQTSSDTGLSLGNKIGLGVGIGIGVAAVGLGLVILYRTRQVREWPREQPGVQDNRIAQNTDVGVEINRDSTHAPMQQHLPTVGRSTYL